MGKKGYLFVATVGSTAGSYIPVLFGASGLSGWSIIGGMVGGFAALYFAFKLFG